MYPPQLISSVPELEEFLSMIPTDDIFFVDFKGDNLGRHGNLSFITVFLDLVSTVGVIDVLALGESTFTTASKEGKTLKSLLEDPDIAKKAWDAQNGADALWALYQVSLDGFTEIRLLENATRMGDKTYLQDLEKSVQDDVEMESTELEHWLQTKREVETLMTADIFTVRPVDAKTVEYCSNEVAHLPDLYVFYLERLNNCWCPSDSAETDRRMAAVRSPEYDPQSPLKNLGPWGSGIEEPVGTLEEKVEEPED